MPRIDPVLKVQRARARRFAFEGRLIDRMFKTAVCGANVDAIVRVKDTNYPEPWFRYEDDPVAERSNLGLLVGKPHF